jgi:hypothetical protein
MLDEVLATLVAVHLLHVKVKICCLDGELASRLHRSTGVRCRGHANVMQAMSVLDVDASTRVFEVLEFHLNDAKVIEPTLEFCSISMRCVGLLGAINTHWLCLIFLVVNALLVLVLVLAMFRTQYCHRQHHHRACSNTLSSTRIHRPRRFTLCMLATILFRVVVSIIPQVRA